MATRVAIVGPGAVGCAVAAALSMNGDVRLTMCARSHLGGVSAQTPFGLVACAPDILLQPDSAAPVDFVVVATKAYDSASAALWLPSLCRDGAPVLILQNGVDHVARFAPFAPGLTLIPAVVDLPCQRDAPGRVTVRRSGAIVTPAVSAAGAFCALFVHPLLSASTTTEFAEAAWSKLCFNCAGAISAVTGVSNAIVRDRSLENLVVALVEECVAVAAAEGVKLSTGLAAQVAAALLQAPPEGVNSLLADRRAGRQMEIAVRNGFVVTKARQRGIATPVNDVIVSLLEAIDRLPRTD